MQNVPVNLADLLPSISSSDNILVKKSRIRYFTCPLEAGYIYVNSCNIRTCKYNSDSVSTKCYLIASRSNTSLLEEGRISDVDLFKWRGAVIGTQDALSIRSSRKEALKRINSVIILDRYLRFLESVDNTKYKKLTNALDLANSYIVDRVPFTIHELNFNPDFSHFMFNEDAYNDFLGFIDSKLSVERYSQVTQRSKKIKLKAFKTKASVTPLWDLCFMLKSEWESLRNKLISSRASLFN